MKKFWPIFKNFTGDGPFTYKGKPWIYGILFYVAIHENKHWLNAYFLQEFRKDQNFFSSCSYINALKLMPITDSGILHYRTLDWCHRISVVLINIQNASGIRFAVCANLTIFFSDMHIILGSLNDQTNSEKRFSCAKRSFSAFKTCWEQRHRGQKCPFQ